MEQQDIFTTFVNALANKVADIVCDRMASYQPTDDLIPRKEAARMLDTSEQTLIRWEQCGEIKARRIGRKVYYSKNELMNR